MKAATFLKKLYDLGITPRLNGRLINLSLREQRGLEADQLDITLADHDGALALPRRGGTQSEVNGG